MTFRFREQSEQVFECLLSAWCTCKYFIYNPITWMLQKAPLHRLRIGSIQMLSKVDTGMKQCQYSNPGNMDTEFLPFIISLEVEFHWVLNLRSLRLHIFFVFTHFRAHSVIWSRDISCFGAEGLARQGHTYFYACYPL